MKLPNERLESSASEVLKARMPRSIARELKEAQDHLTRVDERLGEVIAEVGPCLLGVHKKGPFHTQGHFAGLVEAIVSQQLSSKAADTIFGRVRSLGGNAGGFPSPREFAQFTEQELRGCGLSGAKTRYVQDLTARIVRGELDLDRLDSMPDERVIEALCKVIGVGKWTAQMFLMFRLHRLDVLPTLDLGIQKGMKVLFRLRERPTPERMTALSKKWRPYRTVACWYLWRLLERNPIAVARASRADRKG